MRQIDSLRLASTLLCLGLAASGCASGGTNTSSPSGFTGGNNQPPPPPPQSLIAVTKQNASALVSAAIGGGSVPALIPELNEGIPTPDLANPNGTALGLALAVALKWNGSIASPLGGTVTIQNGAATFAAFKTPTGTIDGQITVGQTVGKPAGDLDADVTFQNLRLSGYGSVLEYIGGAHLQVTHRTDGSDTSWTANFSAADAARSLNYQNFVATTQIRPGGATQTLNGDISLINLNRLNGRLRVETSRPLEFRGAVGSSMRLGGGQLTVFGDAPVQVSALGAGTDLTTVRFGADVSKLVSWNYLGGLARLLPALRPVVASTILRNANIITVNDARPRAQAMAIRDGRILKVGSEAEVVAFRDASTEVVDLKGKTLLPGFIEPHMHYDLTALSISGKQNGDIPGNRQLVDCGLYDPNNPAAQELNKSTVLARLNQAVDNQAKGIFGSNFDPSRLTLTDRWDTLTRADLDGVDSSIPVVVQNASGHISYANSKAFALAKKKDGTPIWPTAPNPPYIPPPPPAQPGDLDPNNIIVDPKTGLPTGQLDEEAQVPFLGLGIGAALDSTDAAQAGVKKAAFAANWGTMQNQLAEKGVTTAVDILMGANTTQSLDAEAALVATLEAREECPTRARIYVNGLAPIDNINVFAGEGNSRMRFLGAKFITDGSTQGFTGGLNFNYINPSVIPPVLPVIPTPTNGLVDFVNSLALLQVVQPYYDRGFQLCFHVNGDRAFDILTGALQMLPADIKSRRTRLEHFTIHQNIAQGGLNSHAATCVQLGLYPGHTIGHVFYWGGIFNGVILDPDVAQNIDPVKAFLDSGIKVSLHSDSPISPVFPMLYLQTAVTRFLQVPPGATPGRLGPQHAVTALEAIKCITIYPAEAAFSEQEIGSLEEGKFADTVLLDQDPTVPALANDPNAISRIAVLQTRLAGRLVSGANP